MRSGLSQQKLAAKMGVNRGTIANWEQGLAAISLPMAMRWFTCCGVSAARYMDACIHPGLLEHLEDDPSDMEKRQILIDAMMECSSYEIDALLYIRYGDHGSDHIGVLTEILPISARLIANKASYQFKTEEIHQIVTRFSKELQA